MMRVLARGSLVRRLVDAVRRGRAPVVLGGPGMGKTSVARAGAERLLELSTPVEIFELPDDDRECAEALGEYADRKCILVGGLTLHRELEASGPACRLGRLTVQRFPLVPLIRRDVRAWGRSMGLSLSDDEFERLFEATGGHPSMVAAWFEILERSTNASSIAALLGEELEPLFARIDAELAHPELAGLYAWLAEEGPATVGALRKATGGRKGSIDRLVIAGPVSRILGEVAEIAIGCGLYARHRAR